jgi:hypothetical protein
MGSIGKGTPGRQLLLREARMNRLLFASVGALLLAVAGGCAMCDNSQDCTYASYGGKWQREDPCCGRVGSLFAPAGAPAVPQQPHAYTSSQSDDEQSSVLAPQDVEHLDQELQGGESIDAAPTDTAGEPLDLGPMDISIVDDESAEAPGMDVDAADAASMDAESAGAAPTDAEAAETDATPQDEASAIFDDLDIKREPLDPMQPSDQGELPALDPSPDLDE